MKSRGGKSQGRVAQKKEDQRRKRFRKKKLQVRDKVENSPNTVFFQCVVAPEGRKVGSAGAEPSAEMRNEKPHAEAQFESVRGQNAKSTSASERFKKLTC